MSIMSVIRLVAAEMMRGPRVAMSHLMNTAILLLFVTFSAAAQNQSTPKPNSPTTLQPYNPTTLQMN